MEDPAYVRASPSIMRSIPGIDLHSAVSVQFLSGMPDVEHERVRKVIQLAQNQLRASDASKPSRTDAWIVAVQVPRFVSTWKVAELFKKELEDGHFTDIAGVMVMHVQQAGTVGPHLTFTKAERIGLVANLVGGGPLTEFMDGDSLPILVEGTFSPFHPYYEVRGRRFYFDGYVHRDVGPATFQSTGPSITIAPPPFIPEIVFDPEDLPAIDAETRVPLDFSGLTERQNDDAQSGGAYGAR